MTIAPDVELKPCPLCGCDDITRDDVHWEGAVGCSNCSCESDYFNWNTRTPDQVLLAENERLKANNEGLNRALIDTEHLYTAATESATKAASKHLAAIEVIREMAGAAQKAYDGFAIPAYLQSILTLAQPYLASNSEAIDGN